MIEPPNILSLTTATGAVLTLRPRVEGGAEISIENDDDECYAELNAASYRAFRAFLTEETP